MSRGKLTKSSSDKVLAGVCGGLASYFNLDPVLVRVGYVLLSFLLAGFPGLMVYIVLAIMMPSDY